MGSFPADQLIVRLHDLRHTWATVLLSRNVHPSTIAMTLDTYSYLLPSIRDQAAGAMGDALV